MKGRHIITVISRRASYKLELERKVSVIKGNSGTGKSSLLRLISDYLEYGKKSGIKLSLNSNASLGVMTNSSAWGEILSSVHNTVLFIDEDVEYLYRESFQRELWRADCYAVIVSRSGMLRGIPYAILGIYELVTEKRGDNTATAMYQLYAENNGKNDFELVLTEDSNSGYEMAKYAFASDNTKVVSAGGNSSVLPVLKKTGQSPGRLCAIADGAAFGAYIEPVLKYAELRGNMRVSAPESFEYILLNFSDVKKYLSADDGELLQTYDYCEGTEYSTWEQYYENLLGKITSEHFDFKYNKKNLNPRFRNKKCAKEYIDLICKCFVERRNNGGEGK